MDEVGELELAPNLEIDGEPAPVVPRSLPATRSERLHAWLVERPVIQVEGPEVDPDDVDHTHAWWKVMCLTGVDYFSTLGYLPAIAVLLAGTVAPIAVLFIVALTLFGMVPVYRRVAEASPSGKGSVAMLETALDFWKGKLLVLVLLGFVATAWFMTITLSVSDAAAHVVGNPLVPDAFDHPVLISLALVAALGVVFLRGLTEAIGVAVVLVVGYMSCNAVIIGGGVWRMATQDGIVSDWQVALTSSHGSWDSIALASLLAFPPLALGLSGFETGVAMMPLVRGDGADREARIESRIRRTRLLLVTAALTMSVFLVASTTVATLLVPEAEFAKGGDADGRALAWLAHDIYGAGFGSAYDAFTVAILWFAGASALAGLLNIVPRYLPHYGMAPDWTLLMRPLVLLNTMVALALIVAFQADVEAQAGAYATGVLAMMLSASFAVLLYAARRKETLAMVGSAATTAVLAYSLVANEIKRPDGLVITLLFIAGIVVGSLVSRVMRSTELRAERVELDELALQFVHEAARLGKGQLAIVAHRPRPGDGHDAYAAKEREQRLIHHMRRRARVLFLEMQIEDSSGFAPVLRIEGRQIGSHRVLAGSSSTVPNAIAALLLHLEREYGYHPHCYFGWTEGNPLSYVVRYVLFGEGDTAPVTREVIRQAESDPTKRPSIHVGG